MILFQCCITSFLIFKIYSKSIDQKILEASNGTSLDLVYSKDPDVYRIELDILMKKEEYLRQERGRSGLENERKKRKAIMPTSMRWTNKVIPYTYQASTFSSYDKSVIEEAIAEINNYTCLKIKPGSSSNANRINFVDGSGCTSYVGMIGGVQKVTLASGCRYKDIVVHELGHALGFYHEQSRRDRDAYVEILSDNIIPQYVFAFNKREENKITNMDVPYDYLSVMHYGKKYFSSNGQNTIRTIDSDYQNVIGKAPGLSFKDIKLANIMYNCNEDCRSNNCPSEGFQGKNCECYCPHDNANKPIKLCYSVNNCQDRLSICPLLRFQCKIFPRFMNYLCPKSCDQCSGPAGVKEWKCQDSGKNCGFMKSQGHCEKKEFLMYMATNCPRTCGYCIPRQGGDQ